MPLESVDDVSVEERVMQELLCDSLADYVRLILTDYREDIIENMGRRKRAVS